MKNLSKRKKEYWGWSKKDFAKVSPKIKMEWLEEINKFIERFVPLSKRELWQKLHRGEAAR